MPHRFENSLHPVGDPVSGHQFMYRTEYIVMLNLPQYFMQALYFML